MVNTSLVIDIPSIVEIIEIDEIPYEQTHEMEYENENIYPSWMSYRAPPVDIMTPPPSPIEFVPLERQNAFEIE